ncbi:MAG: RsmB/NOP family class I SAM-dependent RNA methyltransferase [Promethearchaeota archaeon]
MKFLNGELNITSRSMRKNPRILHYYNEIVRFLNKLNFIIKRTLPNSLKPNTRQLAYCLYVTYRIFWEKASIKTIFKEVKEVNKGFLKNLRQFSWEKALQNKNNKEKLSICEAVPSFMIDQLLPVMSQKFIKDNIRVMNGAVGGDRTTVRINRLLERKFGDNLDLMIKSEFERENIPFTKDSHVEDLLTIPSSMKKNVLKSSIYQKGYLINQDKASAAVVQALSPQSGELICDMCAAPGIKTSLIAQKMKNQGQIIAGEFLNKRIKIMKQLLNQLNVLNTFILNIDSIVFPLRFENMFDRVLLDAPCTGSGTFLTNPELKWRQNKRFLHQNTILQKKLFQSALKMLKTGGILVYSTCSLYPQEGEHIIIDFLNQLQPQILPAWFSPSYMINNSELPGIGRLFPSVHQTQGFFIGKFKKKEI